MKPVWIGLCAALLLSGLAMAATDTRTQEMASCQPGEMSTWKDGQDRPVAGGEVRVVYRHQGAPSWFSEAMVLSAVQRAAQAWSDCGVPATVISESAAALYPASLVVVQWNEAQTRGNFALANLSQRTLSLSADMFKLLAQRNPSHPAVQTLQMTLSHEMGHFFGLMSHSRRCIDVMSYYHDGQGQTCFTRDGRSYKAVVEYRSLLPTACDLARCRALNGH